MDAAKGIVASLFDFSFTNFVTLKMVKIWYGISVAMAGLAALVFLIFGFTMGSLIGVLALIASPIIFLLLTLGARIYWEMIIVFFKIEENTRK